MLLTATYVAQQHGSAFPWQQWLANASHSCIKAESRIACRTHAAPMLFPCHAVPLIHTCHAAPIPCSDSAVSFVEVRVVAGKIRTASPTV
jgi:hypothetical protein